MKYLLVLIFATSLYSDTLLTALNKCIKDNYYYVQSNGRFYYQLSNTSTWSYTTTKYNSTQLIPNYQYQTDGTCIYVNQTDLLNEDDYNLTLSKTHLLVIFGAFVLFGALISTSRTALRLLRS